MKDKFEYGWRDLPISPQQTLLIPFEALEMYGTELSISIWSGNSVVNAENILELKLEGYIYSAIGRG